MKLQLIEFQLIGFQLMGLQSNTVPMNGGRI